MAFTATKPVGRVMLTTHEGDEDGQSNETAAAEPEVVPLSDILHLETEGDIPMRDMPPGEVDTDGAPSYEIGMRICKGRDEDARPTFGNDEEGRKAELQHLMGEQAADARTTRCPIKGYHQMK